jgi:GNAT superfamily N-acetyltransferase
METATVRDRPDVVARAWELTRETLPEYNNHGDVLNRYWSRLTEELPEFQFHLLDGDEPVARARTIPIHWDGTADDLPEGIDGAIARGFDEDGANTLCALIVAVPPSRQRGGISRLALEAMIELAQRHALGALVAPVRPSLKERYPLIPIERYARWTRDDGLPFDPWMRVHARLGGTILKTEPHSLRITGTVDEWEDWTGMAFPGDGEYVFPHGLAPVSVDDGRGMYWEPNVWTLHAWGST